ncbi:leucine-rich repeat-containing protein 14-like [Oenanthe melanoleuca]|uniref:leucine-rich repeat-containing protein 14-like n=1 Tax=Oenanthe melanoleuca TaxID=2939378 RepID=UPI0024C13CD3|nr:leucine-rich repeat-containing protein 14-like [Oenanthe melanoleuca]
MDSLLFLCARRIVAQRPLPALPDLPANLYPVLFQAAFMDGRPLALQDLVAAWPFPELHFQRLVGHRELHWDHPGIDCVKAVIQAVVEQLRQELEEPGPQSSRCRLRVLDMTGLCDSVPRDTPDGWTFWSRTQCLAEACVEVSKHQQEFQRRGSKRHKGCSGATTAEAALQHPGVDIHADLVVDETSYRMLRDALQIGATGLLRLKCREFQTKLISASEIVTLLESVDPSCLRRVDLCSLGFGDPGLSVILPHLSRFPELRSLKLWHMDRQHPTPESAMRMHCMARHLGMLPSLWDLNLGPAQLPGNLSQILCDLQAPLESLELPFCNLLPIDLTFLSQSIHALALKRLDLRGLYVSEGLLDPLQLLLEKASASLLYLDLAHCHVTDFHLATLLPTLLRCSRLRFLGLYGNSLSTAAIKDLLQKALELPDLRVVVYPIPKDCYTQDPLEFEWYIFVESVDEELLSAAKAEISHLLVNSGRTNLVWTDDPTHKALDYFSL